MASFTNSAVGRLDLEPFWPSRRAYHSGLACCRRAITARARSHR
ncbi:hypothetical protein [Wenjunlia tyrosinilytica]|nr:hypothetical protein [Wenjunlia tyrosinilytica]